MGMITMLGILTFSGLFVSVVRWLVLVQCEVAFVVCFLSMTSRIVRSVRLTLVILAGVFLIGRRRL